MKKLFICLLIISIIGSLPVFAITEESEDSIETARIIKNADHDKDLNIKERKNPKKKGKKKLQFLREKSILKQEKLLKKI